MNANLKTKLQATVVHLDSYLNILDRSHAALHTVLACSFDLYLDAKNDEEGFADLARSLDVDVSTTKAAHPLALMVIKAVFHNIAPVYDLRREFGRWSVVLVHLDEAGVSVDGAETYLGNGGVYRCLTQYKKDHTDPLEEIEKQKADIGRIDAFVTDLPKIGTTTKPYADEEVTIINTAQDHKTLVALAQKPGRVLLLGEIDDEFNLRLVGIVERDQKAVEVFLLRKAKATTLPPYAVNDDVPANQTEKEVA